MMKLLTLFTFFLVLNLGFSQNNDSFFKDADTFLKTYVYEGKVDYEGVAKIGKLELANLIDFLANNSYDESIKKAYLINAYNLFVIDQIVSNYPISSPMDVTGFFENKNSILNGEMISLNVLENELLRKTYKDPRLHFVLVCGGLGCPPITNFAYTPIDLEKQLEQQTTIALNNSEFVYQKEEEKSIYLSEIFTWYTSDFGKNNKEVITYINSYRQTPFSTEFKVKNYTYDWTINSGRFIKGVNDITPTSLEQNSVPIGDSSISTKSSGGQSFNAGSLLRKGQFDFTLFNTLYTQTKSNWLAVDYSGNRETFNTHLIQMTYGVSKSKRVNIGLDINFKSSGSSTDSTVSGIATAFDYKNTSTTRVGITSVGLRLKLQPFKKVSNFTMQSTLLAPTIKFAEGNSDLYWADWERLTWWDQFFYTKTFGKFQLFTELDLLFRFKIYDNQISMLDIPMSAFLSYFPTNKITIYAMSQHVPRITNQKLISNDWVIPSNYTASGLGFKYQFNRGLNLELLYSNFWRGTNSGLGSTFNIGIKYITK